MAVARSQKESQLSRFTEVLQSAKGVVFASFEKATVEEVQQVRREARSQGMTYSVIKKTLIAHALKTTKNITIDPKSIEGMIAVIMSPDDEIAPAGLLKKYKKVYIDNKTKISKFDFSGMIFDGKLIDKEASLVIADTPTREESFAKIIATLRFGVKGIHSTLTHGLRGITLSLKEAEKFSQSS